jgi:hypothetical protein
MLKQTKTNMSSELNTENRNARIVLPIRRCCSFCRNNGHNILTCNDVRLVEFEQLCVARQSSLGIDEFRIWLLDYSLELPSIARAYAVRFCGCTIRSYMHICVSHIIERINRLNVNTPLILNEDNETESNQTLRQSEENLLEQIRQRMDVLERLSTGNVIQVELNNNVLLRDIINIVESVRDFINNFHEEDMNNRKFDIQTNIVECVNKNECECSICYDSKMKPEFVKLNCGHEFCKDCIKQSLKNVRTENPQCAFCRAEIKNMELTNEDIRNEFNDLINASV